MVKKYDVVIVGLGASGAIIARELAEAGMSVLGLDKGDAFTLEDRWHKFDELKFSTTASHCPTTDRDPMTWRERDGQTATLLPWAQGPTVNPFTLPPSLGLGGGSWHYAGWHFRQLEEDFRMRSEIIERYGKERLPVGSRIEDWPLTYADLEPYYDKVDYEIGTNGRASNLADGVVPGGNPFEAPRSRDYPYPPLRRGAVDALFQQASARLGYHPYPAPTAIISEDRDERKGCTYCGFCRDYLCHVGAKSDTRVSMIPKALATGNLEIRTNARVQQLTKNAKGRIESLAYVDTSTGEAVTVEADSFVLAAYVLENVRLMLVSGLNQNGKTGKYFHIHDYDWAGASMPEDTQPFVGPAAAGSVVDDFNGQNYDWSDHDFVWGAPILSFVGDLQPIEGAQNAEPDNPRWGPEFKSFLRNGYRKLTGLVSIAVQFPMEQNYLDLDPTVKDRWGAPALRITHAWTDHERAVGRFMDKVKLDILREMGAEKTWVFDMEPAHITTHDHGGHVMGDDPTDSVVNRYQQSHEAENLFVVGGGSFTTVGGYNPTATIQALAYWTADYMKSTAGCASR